jgi:hypothetical protein
MKIDLARPFANSSRGLPLNVETLSGRTCESSIATEIVEVAPMRESADGLGAQRHPRINVYVYIALQDNCRQKVESRDDELPEASDAAQTRRLSRRSGR